MTRKRDCPVFAGYIWDTTSPFVSDHRQRLGTLSNLVATGSS